MKIRKCFLLVMSLVSINFLNLNASESLVSSMKLNLAQKMIRKFLLLKFIKLMENYPQEVSMS